MGAVIRTYLKNSYGYTDFQIAQIRYTLLSILSELSKLIMMGCFFYFTKHLPEFVLAAVVLCVLRTATGGLHFQHYWSCLLMSLAVFFTGIQVLPLLPVTKHLHILMLGICIWLNYRYAPIASSYRPVPNGVLVRKAKVQSFLLITVYAVLLFIIPDNPYLPVGSWIIILQSLQLYVANIQKRRNCDETSE